MMAFLGTDPIRAKSAVDGTALEQVSHFEYLGCSDSYIVNNDVMKKFHKFNHMYGSIRRTLKSTGKENA